MNDLRLLTLGAAVPFCLALGMALLARLERNARRAAGQVPAALPAPRQSVQAITALAPACAFLLGFVALEGVPAPLRRYWHYLPVLSASAGLLAAVLVVVPRRMARFGLAAAMCGVAGWLLVPTWSDLQPIRPISSALLAVYMLGMGILLELVGRGIAARALSWWLTLAGLAVAMLLAAAYSVTYGALALSAAAGMAGVASAGLFIRRTVADCGHWLWYAVTIGGWAYVGYVEPRTPRPGILLAAAAPLALWCGALLPRASNRVLVAALSAGAMLAVLGIAAAYTFAR